MTNQERAKRGQAAFDAYVIASCSDDDPQTIFTDMLTDLRHLCDLMLEDEGEKVDFDRAFATSTMHYTAEVSGDE